MKRLVDSLRPKGDVLQLVLKKQGRPVAGIYVDEKGEETRSPALQNSEEVRDHDDDTAR